MDEGHQATRRFRRRLPAFLALGAVILTGASGLAYWLISVFVLGNVHTIVEGVAYRSGQPSPALLERLEREVGIRSVINLRGDWKDDDWYRSEKRAADDLGLRHYDIHLRTHQLAPPDELRKLVAAFDECPKPLLIHCRQGADRASLASAIYLVLFEGRSPEEAVSEYKLRYGHTGWAYGSHLPHLFDCYRQWLGQRSTEHSPRRFREWIGAVSTVGYFGARIEPVRVPNSVPLGQPVNLTFRVTNVSRLPWTFADRCEQGIHLAASITHPNLGERTTTRAGSAIGAVEPGAAVTIRLRLPPFERVGRHEISVDMRDGYGMKFCEMGLGGSRSIIVVEASDTTRSPIAIGVTPMAR